jgi:hypothetical protein
LQIPHSVQDDENRTFYESIIFGGNFLKPEESFVVQEKEEQGGGVFSENP